MEVGDIIVALKEADNKYGITKGEEFEGEIIKKRSFDESLIEEEEGETIEVKVIKAENEQCVGEYFWVDERYFKLKKNILSEVEDF